MTFCSVEAAIDPTNRLTFLLDWELTMKCNLDCDYCPPGIHGGHDNTQRHPPLEDCLKSIDFMYQYADLQMSKRRKGLRHVVLNVYGGEALHHPDIEQILSAARSKHEKYKDRWTLLISTTTNAIVTSQKFEKICNLIDEFTVSWHTNNTDKQKQQFRKNVLTAKENRKSIKCIILMHPELFEDAQKQIDWCTENDVKFLSRQLDVLDVPNKRKHLEYQQSQVVWFDKFYKDRSYNVDNTVIPITDSHNTVDLTNVGRACCGGRQLCVDENYKQRSFYVNNKFPDWYCSVNQFFLYVKQVNGEVYTNKDCKMNYHGTVGPIGNLKESDLMLEQLSGELPNIQCKKSMCFCGLCAPKAQTLDQYNQIMEKYLI